MGRLITTTYLDIGVFCGPLFYTDRPSIKEAVSSVSYTGI